MVGREKTVFIRTKATSMRSYEPRSRRKRKGSYEISWLLEWISVISSYNHGLYPLQFWSHCQPFYLSTVGFFSKSSWPFERPWGENRVSFLFLPVKVNSVNHEYRNFLLLAVTVSSWLLYRFSFIGWSMSPGNVKRSTISFLLLDDCHSTMRSHMSLSFSFLILAHMISCW